MTAAVAAGADNSSAATTMKRGWYVDQTAANGKVQFTINGVSVPATAYTLTGNAAVDALNIASTANKDLATAAGVTLNAKVGGFSSQTVSLIQYADGTQATGGERYTSAAVSAAATTASTWAVGVEDEFTLTVGSNSVTTSLGGQSISSTSMAEIEEAIQKAWEAKYGGGGTASLSAIATVADNGDGVIAITMLQTDSGGYGKAVSFGVTDKDQSSGVTRTSANIGYHIGATKATSDNPTIASSTKSLIITLESPNNGTLQNSVLSAVTTLVSGARIASMVEYTTTYVANSAWTGATSVYAGVSQPRTDVVTAEDSVANTASAGTAATKFNRVTWLG